MKKLLFLMPLVALLAASCNSTGQISSQPPAPTAVVQNTNLNPTPTSTPTAATSPTSKQALAISSVTGPKSLTTNQQGSWIVTINDPNGAGHSYSVIWGEPGTYAQDNVHIAAAGPLNAKFLHAYSTAGTYSLTFKVTSDSGQTAQSSINVSVASAPANTSTITLDAATKVAVVQAIRNDFDILASNDAAKIRTYFLTEYQDPPQEAAQFKAMSDSQLLQAATDEVGNEGQPSTSLATDPAATWKLDGNTVTIMTKSYAAPNPAYPAIANLNVTYQAVYINGAWY